MFEYARAILYSSDIEAQGHYCLCLDKSFMSCRYCLRIIVLATGFGKGLFQHTLDFPIGCIHKTYIALCCIRAIGVPMSEQKTIEKLLAVKSWPKLTMTQQVAVDNDLLRSQENFVLIAPTSAGKTGVAQLAAMQALDGGQRVLYLVPMKSLISDKEKDFQDISAEIAGTTSQPAEWEKANIVITTFETFYKTALLSPHLAKDFGLAVIDEFQVLYDKMRGFNLEKVITVLRELGIRIICLSATFEDKNEIAEWLKAKVVVVPEEARKVKIEHGVIDLSSAKSYNLNQQLGKTLYEMDKAPYLIFCTSKESTVSRAKVMSTVLNKNILREDQLRTEFVKKLSRKKLTELEETLLGCMVKGVAFHHSALDQRLKSFVEDMFANKAVNYLFATTGLAYGVNFPARTVVVADTSFYDSSKPGKREPIPIYMYIQMAGRAGRTGFGTDGYSYVVKKKGDTDSNKYQNGKIERAVSVVGQDDYFRKTILELIYSGRARDEQILDFFKNTFFNFQSEKQAVRFIPFDLFKTLQEHVEYLYKNGFISNAGVAGYKLTGLGEVTIGFLFSSFASYPLAPFVQLNHFLLKDQKVRTDFDIIFNLTCLFNGACLIKYPRERVESVSKFYEGAGVPVLDQRAPHYSALAIFDGWLNNKEIADIEDYYKVYASQCPQVAVELFKLLGVYEKLAAKSGIEIPKTYRDFKDRVRFGVTEEELPFVRLRGIGRGATRSMKLYCENFLRQKPWNLNGTILEILEQIYLRDGERRFKEVLQYIKGIGKGKKHDKILELVKNRCAKQNSNTTANTLTSP